MTAVTNRQVQVFWESHPVAAAALAAIPGTHKFYRQFDVLREADDCEPYPFSNRIHGYDRAAGKRVLDVGCGNGYVLERYARHGAEVFGIDLTETALGLSRQRFALAALKAEFRPTDGNTIPYPDDHFDIVCAMGVLHHIANPRPMVTEMRRVLRPGGELILMLYHRHSWKYHVVLRLKRLFDPRYRGKSQAEALNMNDGADCPLARVYSKAEARRLLADFADIRFTVNLLSWKQLFLSKRLARWLVPTRPASESWFARRFGWNLYVSARKPWRT